MTIRVDFYHQAVVLCSGNSINGSASSWLACCTWAITTERLSAAGKTA
jgi:hypothetical protein